MLDFLPAAATTVESARLTTLAGAARTFASYSLFAWAGILAGLAVDRVNRALDAPLRGAPRVLAVAAKLSVVVAAAVLLQFLAPALAFEWQAVAGGVFFVAFFFATQSSLLSQATW